MVTGAGLRKSSVPQNLGMGQNEYPDRNILGMGRRRGVVEMTKGKLTYHFGRSLHRNDEADARAQLLGPPWRDLELQTQTAARSVAASGSARLVVQTADVRH